MPPQRRQREYETAVDPDAIHAEPEKLAGFGEKRTVIKDAELEELRAQAQQVAVLREQLSHALEQQGQGSNALAVREDGALVVQGFQFSPIGLIASDQFSSEAWEQIGHLLLRLEGSIQWLIGDWLVYGDGVKWGDATKFADTFGRDPGTLHNYASVSRAIQFSFRNENLTYTHHVAVSGLTPEQQVYALEYAAHGEEKPLSVARFRAWIKSQLGEQPALALPLPAGDLDIKVVSREVQRFMQRDPSTFQDEDREAARDRADQLYRIADALKRHAGLDE